MGNDLKGGLKMGNEQIWMLFALLILLTVGVFKMTEAPHVFNSKDRRQ